jgi:copper homeostasis protein
LLEVTVLHARDAAAATTGEADRLLFVADPASGGRSPDPSTVSAIVRETDLPVRVMLRTADSLEVDAAGFAALVTLAHAYVELGAEGLSFGFLDRDLEIDRATCSEFAAEVSGVPWTFHRGFDSALEARRAWREVVALPGLDGVASGGSTRGLSSGSDELISRAQRDPQVAALVLAAGGLDAEHVPWLIRAGVRQFGVSAEVRPNGSWTKAYVDTAAVRAWRLLIDDAHQRALGVAVE